MRKCNGPRTVEKCPRNLDSHGQKLHPCKAARPFTVRLIYKLDTLALTLSVFDHFLIYPWLIQAVILLAPALMILLQPYYGQRNRKTGPVRTRVI
jgi:hypothetical protein